MEQLVKFLVGITLYSKRQSIRRTIETVLSQSYRNFDLLVKDDGSTDGSLEAIGDLLQDEDSQRILFKCLFHCGSSL